LGEREPESAIEAWLVGTDGEGVDVACDPEVAGIVGVSNDKHESPEVNARQQLPRAADGGFGWGEADRLDAGIESGRDDSQLDGRTVSVFIGGPWFYASTLLLTYVCESATSSLGRSPPPIRPALFRYLLRRAPH
jgi:hypothetical protein